MADNRQSKRTPVTLKIKFKSETLDQFINRYAVDVSHGGIFIRTKDPLPVGTSMRFEFQLKDSSPLIKGEGTVVWTREQDPSRAGVAPGMGVRFERLADGSREILEQILARKTNKSSSRGFVDTPTRVAPSPLVQDLARGTQSDAASKRLPSPTPFQSDVDEFASDTFDQATKVHSMADLAKLSAKEDVSEIQQTLRGGGGDDDVRRRRADSEGPTRLVGDPDGPMDTLLYERDKEDGDNRAATVPFHSRDMGAYDPMGDGSRAPSELDDLDEAFGGDQSMDEDLPTRALELPEEASTPEYDPDLDDEPYTPPPANRSLSELPGTPMSPLAGLARVPTSDPLETIDRDAADVDADETPSSRADQDDDERDAAAAAVASRAASEGMAKARPASRPDSDPGVGPEDAREESKNSIKPFLVVAAILILALAAGAYFMFIHEKEVGPPTEEALQASLQDAGIAPETTATPVEIPDAGPIFEDAAAGDAAAEDAQADEPEGLVMDPDAPRVKKVVRSDPGRAMAELVGTDQSGPTPMTFEVAEGQTYTVRLVKQGFITQEVELDPAKSGPVRATLAPAPMILRITSVPDGARVYVDGRKTDDDTPTDFELPESFRKKRRMKVAIRKPGYEKLNIMVIPDFKVEGDAMVMEVGGTLEVAQPRSGGGGSSSSSDDDDPESDSDGATGGAGGAGAGGATETPDQGGDQAPPSGDPKPSEPSGPTPDWAD